MSISSSTDVLVGNYFLISKPFNSISFRGAELYAQNPNLIKKDENRIRADEVDQENNRQSTLPSIQNDYNATGNASSEL
jgi:hypothetical protein